MSPGSDGKQKPPGKHSGDDTIGPSPAVAPADGRRHRKLHCQDFASLNPGHAEGGMLLREKAGAMRCHN
jgi:hypothetical protein